MTRPALAFLALTACTAPAERITRPAAGYDALRVAEGFAEPNVTATLEFPTGTVLIADRIVGGRPIYCGTIVVADVLSRAAFPTCVQFDGAVIRLHAQTSSPGRPFPVPPGSIERVRVR